MGYYVYPVLGYALASFAALASDFELVKRRDAHKQNRLLLIFPANLTSKGLNLPICVQPPVLLDKHLDYRSVFLQSPLPRPVTVSRE